MFRRRFLSLVPAPLLAATRLTIVAKPAAAKAADPGYDVYRRIETPNRIVIDDEGRISAVLGAGGAPLDPCELARTRDATLAYLSEDASQRLYAARIRRARVLGHKEPNSRLFISVPAGLYTVTAYSPYLSPPRQNLGKSMGMLTTEPKWELGCRVIDA